MILITGHKGFIGQNMMKAFPGSLGYEWGELFPSLDNVSRVIHLGAISSTSCRDWSTLLERNVHFTMRLLEACARRQIPLQIASSAAVYGASTDFREDAKVAPQNEYALSKYLVEKYVLERDWPMSVQLFRYFNVHGPHEEHKPQPSPHTAFRHQAEKTGKIHIFEGSDSIKRDFVPVEYVVDVHRRFFDLPVSGVYNLGTGAATSFLQVAESVSAQTGAEIVEVPMPDIPGYQRFTQADTTKTNSLL
jgi:ADP-L-glycero-D-manno-heptose 6-epimerase